MHHFTNQFDGIDELPIVAESRGELYQQQLLPTLIGTSVQLDLCQRNLEGEIEECVGLVGVVRYFEESPVVSVCAETAIQSPPERPDWQWAAGCSRGCPC